MRENMADKGPIVMGETFSRTFNKRNHKTLSDEELVRMFVEAKDEDALSEIINRYSEKVFRLALRITHNQDDAEDVLQEVFVTLLQKLDTFREESKFSTWLYRVAANASYMLLRNEKKKQENELNIDDYKPYNEDGRLEGIMAKDWSNRPDEALLGWEEREMIEKAINELPLPYRVVFQLRDVEELTNEEVAKILGLTIPAVKSRILRARLFLRDRLSDYFYE